MPQQVERLKSYLASRGKPAEFQAVTADASTREYFRVGWNGGAAIACVYPDPFQEAVDAYVDVTQLFLSAGLPVADIYDIDPDLGVVVQEDLGNVLLRDELLRADGVRRMRLLDEAISLIAQIQLATPTAFERRSVASKLKFDTEKLEWELSYFKEHYFRTFLKRPLSFEDDARLSAEFHELAAELEPHASVLCHRDFHAANLMIDPQGKMRIIDHQDARIGAASYDLVSLLLDRIPEPPPREWLAEKRSFFIDLRVRLGMPRLDEEEFAYQFRLQTVQRCLKAVGTFSFQSVARGKTHFLAFIDPTLRMACRSAESLGRFPAIRELLERSLSV
jgi:N-acetylmuramate 1-kinase